MPKIFSSGCAVSHAKTLSQKPRYVYGAAAFGASVLNCASENIVPHTLSEDADKPDVGIGVGFGPAPGTRHSHILSKLHGQKVCPAPFVDVLGAHGAQSSLVTA